MAPRDDIAELRFPEISFPSIEVQPEVHHEEVVPVVVDGMPANLGLVVFLGSSASSWTRKRTTKATPNSISPYPAARRWDRRCLQSE